MDRFASRPIFFGSAGTCNGMLRAEDEWLGDLIAVGFVFHVLFDK